MKEKKIKKIIDILRTNLNKYNDEYYNQDNSSIPDYAFDLDLHSLEYLEKYQSNTDNHNSPTTIIGSKENNFIIPVLHHYKMYSLKNIYNNKEMVIWENSIKKYFKSIEYICEYKYDGVSINLIYKNGILIQAATRGNGIQGEDVTDNIKTISSIPLKLQNKSPNYLEVRGEIIIPLEQFQEINLQRINNNKKIYSNARNLASGTLKLKNIDEVSKRSLDCVIYSLHADTLPFDSQYDALNYAASMGFKVYKNYQICQNLQEVFTFIKKSEYIRYQLPYQIDGIVIKINNLYQQKIIGFTNKYPRWAVAYKYKTNCFITKLLDVTFQVGRTGVITPVAKFNPIYINGSIIQRASLHNYNIIEKLGIHYGDIIAVEKSGDIIPKIKYIDKTKRNINTHHVSFIKLCPSCNTNLIKLNDEELLYCPNEEFCSLQIIKRIHHFVSRDAMNIPYLGLETIQQLFKQKIILTISDIYYLTYDKLMLIHLNQKIIKKILQGIQRSKYIDFDRFLYALSIRNIGQSNARKLALYFNTLDILINNMHNEIKIKYLGDKVINNIRCFFSKEQNKKILDQLNKCGIIILNINNQLQPTMRFQNKSFLFTGKLSTMTRKEAEILIINQGGRIIKQVASHLNYLIVGNKFGSKFRKSLNIKNIEILDEEEFIKLIK